jgi:hypothetical protein
VNEKEFLCAYRCALCAGGHERQETEERTDMKVQGLVGADSSGLNKHIWTPIMKPRP